MERYPDLKTQPAGARGYRFGQLVYERGVVGIPAGILSGILLSAVLGLFPAIIGTTFASRVIAEEKPRKAWLLYIELMFAIFVLVVSSVVFLLIVMAGGEIFSDMSFKESDFTWRSWVPGLSAGCVAVYAVYNRWDWRLRLGLFVLAIAIRNAFA